MVCNMAPDAEKNLYKMTVEEFELELELISFELLTINTMDERMKLTKLLLKLDLEMQKKFYTSKSKEWI